MKRIFFFLLILAGAAQAQWSAGHFYWSKNGATQKTDSIRFVQGTGATLTQSGNTLTIAATGTGTTPASARANTGWTAQGSAIASDTVVQRIEWGGQQNASFKIFDADNDTIMLRPQQNNGGFLYKDATDALASIDTTGRITSGDSYSAAQTITLDGSKAAAYGGTQPELYIEGSDNDNWGLTINTSDQAVFNGVSGGILNRREQATDIDSLLLDPYGSTNGKAIRYSDNGTVLFAVDTTGMISNGAVATPSARGVWYLPPITFAVDSASAMAADTMWVWQNSFGATVTVDSIHVAASSDDYAISIVKCDYTGKNGALVDAVTASTNGTNLFFITETTITSASITAGQRLGFKRPASTGDRVFVRVHYH